MLLAMCVISCHNKSEGTSLSSAVSSLKISGVVVDENAKPVENAEIFYGISEETVHTTRADGSYSFEVNAENYTKLLKAGDMHYVFARKDKDLLAVSKAINIKEKSEHILPNIELTKKKYALGSVWKHQNGNSPVPFAGAKVSFGPFEAETDDIGKFSLPSLGSGKVALSVNGEGHISRNEFVEVKDNGFLNKPVIMYAEGFLSGDIVPINEYEQASELDS